MRRSFFTYNLKLRTYNFFSKNEQADLTSSQKKILKKAILSLREARK
jgi:hypothetical protein